MVQLLLLSRSVSTPKGCHQAVVECLPLRLSGCLLPRTSEYSSSTQFLNNGKEEGRGLLDASAFRLPPFSGRGASHATLVDDHATLVDDHATLVDDEGTAILAFELPALDPLDQRCLERGMGASPGVGALPHQRMARALYLHQYLLRHLLRRESESLIE